MTREHEDWCHAELKARCAEAAKLRAEVERLKELFALKWDATQSAEAETEAARAEIERQQADIDKLMSERDGWLQEIEQLRAAIESLRGLNNQLLADCARAEAEIERLQAAVENAETLRRNLEDASCRQQNEIERLLAERVEQEQEWVEICVERERPLRAKIARLTRYTEQLRAEIELVSK